jgi:hypothetical protein
VFRRLPLIEHVPSHGLTRDSVEQVPLALSQNEMSPSQLGTQYRLEPLVNRPPRFALAKDGSEQTRGITSAIVDLRPFK